MSLQRSKAVLELGQRLAALLKADDDLLAVWMAHYVAELCDAAERAPLESKVEADAACAGAILELWRYRRFLPAGARPFAELDSVVKTLASLDVNNPSARYYTHVVEEAGASELEPEAEEWLQYASTVDYCARFLIATALRSAAHRSASTSQAWVELARRAGAESGLEDPVVEFLLSPGAEDPAVTDVELRRHLSELMKFLKVGAALAVDLRAQLSKRDGGGEGGTKIDESVADPSASHNDDREASGDDDSDDEDAQGAELDLDSLLDDGGDVEDVGEEGVDNVDNAPEGDKGR